MLDEARVSVEFVAPDGDAPADMIDATNRALRLAAEAKHDAIVIGREALLKRGTIAELCAVAELDPMVGFVEPCTMHAASAPSESQRGHHSLKATDDEFSRGMPRLSHVPVPEEPVLWVKLRMLQEFGLLDNAFSSVRSALSDFVLRANRCGYGVVRANRAQLAKRGMVDENKSAEHADARRRDSEILRSRYPYFAEELARYRASPDGQVKRLLEGLRADPNGRLNILFDIRYLGKIHNGTSELAKRVITEFSGKYDEQYNIYVVCNRDVYDFHEYIKLTNIRYVMNSPEPPAQSFFAAIRLVQPFGDADTAILASAAPVSIVLILDVIAIACMQIDPRLASVWKRMINCVSALGFISDFSRSQFEKRFSSKGNYVGFTALCSTNTKEYGAHEETSTLRDDGYVLLVGNSYEHKFLKETCDCFRRDAPGTRLVVLGLKLPQNGSVSSYEGGSLSDDAVADLYARASVVLFPSHNEGFGLPVMHGLARRKPVVARDLPVFREIRERIPEAENLHLFETTVEMVRFAAAKPVWDARKVEPLHPVQSWVDTAKAIGDAIVEAGRILTYRTLHDRLLATQTSWELGKLEAVAAKQADELANMRITWVPPVEERDIPGRAARFVSKRLERRMRRVLASRIAYSLSHFAWGIVKRLRRH